MSGGAREKALQFLRELPRLSQYNVQGLPGLRKAQPRGYGQNGKERGWGASARQKMYFGPLGYEAGATPIQRKTSFERSYNYGLHAQRQFPPLSLERLQLLIDTGRLDANQPIDLAALCGTKIFPLCPDRNHFGFHLTSDGVDIFRARINIEVQWADEQTIVAVERAGGRLTTAYYDLHSVIALNDPMGFFKSGAPIPRRLTPPGNLLEYYIHPANRGYLADPARVAEERLILGQKYGYEPPDYAQAEDWMSETKDPRQVFYGLEPGWIVNLPDGAIYKPQEPQLQHIYRI